MNVGCLSWWETREAIELLLELELELDTKYSCFPNPFSCSYTREDLDGSHGPAISYACGREAHWGLLPPPAACGSRWYDEVLRKVRIVDES